MTNRRRNRPILIALIACLLLPVVVGQAAPASQIATPLDRAEILLQRLTPEERVGQLFLVSFIGPEAGAGSPTGAQIYDLIVNHHIGGVILSAANDNFLGIDQTIPLAQSLIDQLQRNEYSASQQTMVNPQTSEPFTPAYIPLFIGISQGGDGYPYNQILSGVTPLPSQMAIGATWDPDQAQQVGSVLGSELSALGFNMLLGPSLDVLEPPFSESGGDLGVRTFGGDPFWVGEMGKAFITGVHLGSSGKIAVVAKHFPGFGGSDRLPEDEVATVRKSLEQLKQIELAPFFAVTGNAPTLDATVDGLLTAHIRYQGFQGNIRATTKPVSFDPQAFSELMKLPEFMVWRQNGGVVVSDNLGSRAVRRFYDPTGETFIGSFVARDAFLAGNDLLYLNNFISSNDTEAYTSILQTLNFFTSKYREDAAFAQRVDQSVLRILTLKYRIYGNTFTLNQSLPSQSGINQLNTSSQVTFEIAQRAATLISPTLDELDDAIPEPPGANDKIVFISDTRIFQQCSNCRQEYTLPVNALAEAVIRFYSGGGQVSPSNLTSYSFQDLQDMLEAGSGIMQIENDLRQADWIVFAMSNVTPNVPSSLALRNFLEASPGLYQQKKLIVFALNSPYYLDATDISKLTAYYGLYSRSEKFIEVAARLLFQELQPSGNLPVDVPGIGYSMILATSPDPDQIIPLFLDYPQPPASDGTQTPEPTPTQPAYRVGDTIPVRTGVILDHNGHPVPNDTIVYFFLNLNGEGLTLHQVEAKTSQGVASASLRIDRSGILQIRAESEPAKLSDILQFDIPPENVTATEPPATPVPTETPTITSTSTEVPTPTITPTQTPTPALPTKSTTNFSDWFFSLLTIVTVGILYYWLVSTRGSMRLGVRSSLLAMIGGLLTYSYLTLSLPGSEEIIREGGLGGVMLRVLLGAVLSGSLVLVWQGVKRVIKVPK